MPINKMILCLANSRKLNGRCIAGKEIVDERPDSWLRPVSSRENEEISEYERQYKDGSDPRVMDIIDVPLIKAVPRYYQQENWLLDSEKYWKRIGRLNFDNLQHFVDKPEKLWVNGYHTYNGLNDSIPLNLAKEMTSSLYLIYIEKMWLSVFKPGEAFGNSKRRVQGCFKYNDKEYKLWVTDPNYERYYLAQQDGEYEIGQCYLTISLGEAYQGASYKLIAAIIQPDMRK